MTGPLLAADFVTLLGRGWGMEEASGILASHQIRRRALTMEAADQLHEWATRLKPAFTAENVNDRLKAINDLLARGATKTYVTAHNGLRPHLHFASDDHNVVARVKAVTAGGLAIFIVESAGNRLGICRRQGCNVAYIDISRNGLRAYCSNRCGNHDAVRRHRATSKG